MYRYNSRQHYALLVVIVDRFNICCHKSVWILSVNDSRPFMTKAIIFDFLLSLLLLSSKSFFSFWELVSRISIGLFSQRPSNRCMYH